MTEKQKIIAEIERVEDETNYVPFTDEVLGKRIVCQHLKKFIDSMQEEPASEDFKAYEQQYMQDNKGEIVSVYDRHAGLVDGAAWKEQQYDKAKQEIHQSMSEALAQYGVSAELDDVAQEYIRTVLPRFDKHFPVKSNEIAAAIFFGANWQREQMMKEAFKVEVLPPLQYPGQTHICGSFAHYKAGDKVKVIIIKQS